MSRRWVVLDVGETLVDETRVWSIWADVYRIPRLTFFAVLGGAVARDREHADVFGLLEIDDWRERRDEVERLYAGFQPDDLYPDALAAVPALAAAGYRVAVLANQPAQRSAELRRLGIRPAVMAMSEEMGVSKPDPEFFARGLRLLGDPDPSDVAYVGDRVDNDVEPSAAAGMRAVWLRRGPWGYLHQDVSGAASLEVRSLTELVDRVGEVWAE